MEVPDEAAVAAAAAAPAPAAEGAAAAAAAASSAAPAEGAPPAPPAGPPAPRPAGTRLLHRVPPGTKHALQFGREVLCRLLGAPDRIEWRKCAVGVEGETAATLAFRAAYAPYDFTLAL